MNGMFVCRLLTIVDGATEVRIGMYINEVTTNGQASFLPRDAMLSAVYAVVVCLCVCLSVTFRYCIKTAKRRIMQIGLMPHDRSATLVYTD